MGFKELLCEDLKSFINPEEFGEVHRIGDREMVVLVDNQELMEREKRKIGNEMYRQGIYHKKLLFYVQAEAFGKLPAVGRQLLFDDDRYTIIDAVDEGGIYSISLEAIHS